MDVIRHEKVATLDNYAERFTADGSGNVEQSLQLRWPNEQELWIDRIVIRSGSASFSAFYLYSRSSEATQLREWINVGPTNVAVESTPVVFLGQDQPLVVRWEGLVAASLTTVILTGRYVRRVSRTVPDHAAEGPPASADDIADALDHRELTGAPALGPATPRTWPDQG